MLRKITTILLSITLLLTLCPGTGVFAATTYQTENFDGATAGESYVAFSSLGLTDSLLSSVGTEPVFKIVEATGADGKTTKMLEMKNPTGSRESVRFPSQSFTLNSGTEISHSFNFCIEKLPSAWSEFGTQTLYLELIKDSSNGNYCNSATTLSTDSVTLSNSYQKASASVTVNKGEWYRVESHIASDGYLYNAIYKMNGDALRNPTKTSKQYKNTTTISDLIAVALNTVTTDGQGFVVRIDDIERGVYAPATDGPYLMRSSITGSIPAETNSATVVFDQALSATSVKLTSGGVEQAAPSLALSSSTQNTFTYTLSGLSLEEGKDYELDFTGCTNANSVASAGKISFSTSKGAPVITANTLTEGDEISPIGATATVTFDQVLAEGSKVVVYEEGGEELECTLTLASGSTYSVTLPELKDGTDYTLDFKGCKNAEGTACSAMVSFTTKVVRMIKLTDSFETNLVGTATSGYKGYNTDKSEVSPLYSQARLKNGNDNVLGSSLVTGYGNEGYALQLSTVMEGEPTSSGERMINALETTVSHKPETNPANSTEYEQFVLTYRFNITKKATNSDINFYTGNDNILYYDRTIASIRNLEDGTLVISALYGEDDGRDNVIAPVEENKWYNIVWTIDGNEQVFNFIDDETGKLIFTSSKTLAIPDDGDYQIVIFNGNRTSTKNQNQTVLIDDFTFWKIKPWMAEQKLTANVSGTNTIEMSFNQPVIASSDMFDVYKDVNKENIVTIGTPEFTYPDFCELSVSYKGLRYLTPYTADYSVVVSAGGAGFGDDTVTSTYTFTTGKDPLGLTLIGDISYDSLEQNKVITANLQKDAQGTADLIAAFYSGDSLIGVALVSDKEFAKDEPTPVTFTLESDMSGADTIKVFGWNSLEGLAPAMSAYVEAR